MTACNVLGTELTPCGYDPTTGFYRDGCCNTGPEDRGNHTVCAVVTIEFLAHSKSRGNDLSAAVPAFGFPGLKPGDRWCLCARRWEDARKVGLAPKVDLEATHERALEAVSLADLKAYSLNPIQ